MTLIDRPRLPDFLPPAFRGRASCLDGRRGGDAAHLLRTAFEETRTHQVSVLEATVMRMVAKSGPDARYFSTQTTAVAWMNDETVLIGTKTKDLVTFYPWPLRKGLHSSPSFLSKILAQNPFTWPDFAHTLKDVHDTTKALPCWLPLNGTWTYAPLPAWAKDRKQLERQLASLFLVYLDQADFFSKTFHFSLNGTVVTDTGDPLEAQSSGRCFHAAAQTTLKRGMDAVSACLFDSLDDAWMVDTWLSNDKTQTFINPGTLFSVTERNGTLPKSAHDRMTLLSFFPQSVIRTIFSETPIL